MQCIPLKLINVLCLCAAVLCLLLAGGARGQILQGEWVDDSQAAIDQHRKTDVTVIVLDRQDRAVQGAAVRLIQRRHDFVLGLTLPLDRKPPKQMEMLPVYRGFNAVALDRYSDWSVVPKDTSQVQAERLGAWRDAIDPIRTHFGRVVSADPARNHDRLSLSGAKDLQAAVLARVDGAMLFDPLPDDYDLYADLMQQDMVERKLGHGMLHRVFDRAGSQRPGAGLGVRVRNAVSLQRGRSLASAIQKIEVRQIDIDHVTIEQQFSGTLQPNALKRMFDEYVGSLGKPVTLAGLEVGGPTPVAAALNMETVLRLAFAQRRITGIYLAGLLGEELLEDNAALLNHEGEPTAAGSVLDHLFNKLWWSDEQGTTDERGNVQARVFTGWYVVTATLPDGTAMSTEVYLPKSDRAKLVVLQVTAADQK